MSAFPAFSFLPVCTHCAEILPEFGKRVAFFDDMTLEILLSSISEQEKNAYLQKTISALSDEERNLLQTYFEANMSLLGTSQKLFLHKNTVQYKLNHIYQKCGLNPRVFKDAVLLYLALQL